MFFLVFNSVIGIASSIIWVAVFMYGLIIAERSVFRKYFLFFCVFQALGSAWFGFNYLLALLNYSHVTNLSTVFRPIIGFYILSPSILILMGISMSELQKGKAMAQLERILDSDDPKYHKYLNGNRKE